MRACFCVCVCMCTTYIFFYNNGNWSKSESSLNTSTDITTNVSFHVCFVCLLSPVVPHNVTVFNVISQSSSFFFLRKFFIPLYYVIILHIHLPIVVIVFYVISPSRSTKPSMPFCVFSNLCVLCHFLPLLPP